MVHIFIAIDKKKRAFLKIFFNHLKPSFLLIQLV